MLPTDYQETPMRDLHGGRCPLSRVRCAMLPHLTALRAQTPWSPGCGDATRISPEGNDVILVLIDTLRQDRLSCYGFVSLV